MLLTSLLLSLPLAAAPPQEGEGNAAVLEEAEFARALVNQFPGFEDHAEYVLDQAMKNLAHGSSDRAALELARCDVIYTASKRMTDPNDWLQALGEAGTCYASFLKASAPPALARRARVRLAEVAFNYGNAAASVRNTRELEPEELEAMRSTAEGFFTQAIQAVNESISEFQAMDQEEQEDARFDYYLSLFYRANIFVNWASLYPTGSLECNEHCRRALELLEDFAIEVGETRVPGLQAYVRMADTYALRGEPDDLEMAEMFYRHVIENSLPAEIPEDWTSADIDARQGVMQLAWHGLMRFYLERGRTEEAAELGRRFEEWVENEGVLLTDDGYRVLLQIARLRARQGDYTGAIDLAARVSREKPRHILDLEARAVVQEVLAMAPPEAEIPFHVIADAYEGAYVQKKYELARDGFKILISRLAGRPEANDFGAKAYYYLGRSWTNLNRPLLAAVTFRAGFEQFPDDEEFSEQLARNWLSLAENLRNRARGDAGLDAFFRAAEEAVQSVGGDASGGIAWRSAKGDYDAARDALRAGDEEEALRLFRRAIQGFEKIDRASPYYEQALVQAGLAEYHQMALDPGAGRRAFQRFQEYLENFVTNPENTPVTPRQRKVRKDQTARADYYRGQVKYKEARAGNQEAWNELLQLYEGYLDRHPDQYSYGAATYTYRMEALLALGREQEAEALFEELVNLPFEHNFTNRGAFILFSHFNSKLEDLEGPARREALQKAARYLSIMNQTSARPQFGNLRTEADLRMQLGEWATAAALLERALDLAEGMDGNAVYQTEMDLVEAYLAMDKPGAAKAVIDRYLADPAFNKKGRVIAAGVKIKSGWIQMRKGRPVEVPGSSTTAAEFQEASELLSKLILAHEQGLGPDQNKFRDPEWWRLKLQQAYVLYRWGQVDSSKRGAHRKLIESLERLSPDLGGKVAGEELPQLFRALLAK